MHTQRSRNHRYVIFLLGIVVFALANFAHADPPGRVARVGYVHGPVSFSPTGEDDWVEAALNRPLVTGDRVWADAGARIELQIGTATIRLGEYTSVTLLNLDDRVAQFQLGQGTLNVRVRRLDPDQVVEIDTPQLAYVIRRPGQYRVDVDSNGDMTEVRTSNGQAEVYGDGTSYVVDAGSAYRFFGTNLRDYEPLPLPGIDEFDRWSLERDRSYDNSTSARYVSRDVIGYQDLDAYGAWRAVPEYGNVWTPTQVGPGWAPYQDGHWAWVEPWGWTWVDEAPWGFTVSHYGRWAHIGGRWGWIPGPVAARAVYAPALVAFIGGSNFQISISSGSVAAIGWFPLGPRDVYRPAYPVSRRYFTNVNVSNTVISNTYVTNAYDNRAPTNVAYANHRVPGAVVAVPTTTFVRAQPVSRAAVRVSNNVVVRSPVSSIAEVAPMQASVRGAATQGHKPPPQALERRVVARTTPPPAPVGFAARETELTRSPGKPIDPAALEKLRPAAQSPAPNVEVVAPARTARPAAPPPPQPAQAPDAGKGAERAHPQAVPSQSQSAREQPRKDEARTKQPAPAAAPGARSPEPATPPAPAPATSAKPAQHDNQPRPAAYKKKGDEPQPESDRSANRPSARTQPSAPAPMAAPPVQRTPPEQQRGRPQASTAATPAQAPGASRPEAAPAAASPAASTKAEQRGKEQHSRDEQKPENQKPENPGKGDDERKRK